MTKPLFAETHRDFQSKLVDTCNGDAFLKQVDWGVDGEDIVQP